jgi:MSHA biogenesis protein MshJ
MKQQWTRLLERIDALSLRERVFLFISVIACALALADVLWLSPAQTQYKQLTQRFASQSAELDRLRVELKSIARPEDPSVVVRAEIVAADARLDALNADIKTLVPLVQNGPELEQVLVQLLRRQEGLTLVGLTTLKPEATATGSAAAALPAGMRKRGLELRVSGSYAELVRYVKTLESAMPSLRWGALQLKGEQQPPELTLQVYVVGVQP